MGPIVLFDGMCNFCDDSVNFIIRHDPQGLFKFAPLQSAIGRDVAAKYGIGDEIDSVILIENGQAYTHSSASLRIAKGLGGVWSLAYAFIIVPIFIRDFIYKAFAKNRYRLFGRKDVCMIPTPAVRERFLD